MDGVEGDGGEGGLDSSFTSRALQDQERVDPSMETMRTAVKEEEARRTAWLEEDERTPECIKTEEVTGEEEGERLEGMARVRQIVLEESRRRQEGEDSSESSLSGGDQR